MLQIKQNKLGIDIFPSYRSSLFGKGLPEIDMIYNQYVTSVMEHDYPATTSHTQQLIQMVNHDAWDLNDMEPPELIEIGIQDPLVLFNHLLQENLSFISVTQSGKKEVFNSPVVRLW
ncbi:hypothetical protein AAXE64_27320 [Priestia megaterium]